MDYDPGILAVPRRLFSQNYVDGGCEGERARTGGRHG